MQFLIWTEHCFDSTWVWEKIDIDFLAKRGIAVPADYMQEIRNHNFITGSKYVIERFHLNENAEDNCSRVA